MDIGRFFWLFRSIMITTPLFYTFNLWLDIPLMKLWSLCGIVPLNILLSGVFPWDFPVQQIFDCSPILSSNWCS